MVSTARRFYLASLLVALAGCSDSASRMEPAEPADALVGQQAPHFTATLLDGTPFDLAEHAAQKVVILDFWATWCGPCRAALPTLSEVAQDFSGRGVELFAVNIDEAPETVKEFLTQAGLELTVVMDAGGKIAGMYRADAIPQTVIIDRQGIVRYVHVGTSDDLRERLTRELTELSAGAPASDTAPAGETTAAPRVSEAVAAAE